MLCVGFGGRGDRHYHGKFNVGNLSSWPVHIGVVPLLLPAEMVLLELSLRKISQCCGSVFPSAQFSLTEELHLLHVVSEDCVSTLELCSVRVALVVLSHKGVEVSNTLHKAKLIKSTCYN